MDRHGYVVPPRLVSKISEVAVATSEQSHAGTLVAQNVEKIAAMVEESANSAESANDNVRTLETLAMDLKQSVSRFKL